MEYKLSLPIIVAASFKAMICLPSSNAVVVGSNPTRGMDVGMCDYSVRVVLPVGRDLATG
jgi:hypothetical protein